jgi:lysosomal alpha-mannosidase
MRYDTNIQSNELFYTDANGREVLERKRNYRSSYNYTVYENVSGNYYPVASRIWIKDNQRQMTILTGRNFFLRIFLIKFSRSISRWFKYA